MTPFSRPYFLIPFSRLDCLVCFQVKNNCSLITSLAESNYCSTQQWDPQDPRCAQIILYGNIVTVKYL